MAVKKIYKLLLQDVLKSPRVINVFPNIDFSKVFLNINNCSVSSEGRDVSFRNAHHILPVNDYLYSMSIVKSPLCVFGKLYRESLSHLFFECSFPKPLWPYVCHLLSEVSKSTVIVAMLFFLLFKNHLMTH